MLPRALPGENKASKQKRVVRNFVIISEQSSLKALGMAARHKFHPDHHHRYGYIGYL
jgi:hypothetical protein